MDWHTIYGHIMDTLKAAIAVLLVQVAILVLQHLGVLINDWVSYLGSLGTGVVAIKLTGNYNG